jgi:hypothetical protein
LHVNDLLKIAVESGASDLHLKVGGVPMIRVGGSLAAVTGATRLEQEDMVAAGAAIISAAQRQKFGEVWEMDLACSVPGSDVSAVTPFNSALSGWCSGSSRRKSRRWTSSTEGARDLHDFWQEPRPDGEIGVRRAGNHTVRQLTRIRRATRE